MSHLFYERCFDLILDTACREHCSPDHRDGVAYCRKYAMSCIHRACVCCFEKPMNTLNNLHICDRTDNVTWYGGSFGTTRACGGKAAVLGVREQLEGRARLPLVDIMTSPPPGTINRHVCTSTLTLMHACMHAVLTRCMAELRGGCGSMSN